MKSPYIVVLALIFLTGCSESSPLPTAEEEEAAYRIKTAPQREAEQMRQIEANFAWSLEQQKQAEEIAIANDRQDAEQAAREENLQKLLGETHE